MRMLMQISLPTDVFNGMVKDGSVGATMNKILDQAKPESVYFLEVDGLRTCVMVVDLKEPSQIPFYAEPWFLKFNAKIEMHPAMTPADLAASGLDSMAKNWV